MCTIRSAVAHLGEYGHSRLNTSPNSPSEVCGYLRGDHLCTEPRPRLVLRAVGVKFPCDVLKHGDVPLGA